MPRKRLFLILAALIFAVILVISAVFLVIRYSADGNAYMQFPEDVLYIRVCDPETKQYYHIMDGKLVDGSVDSVDSLYNENGSLLYVYQEIVSSGDAEKVVTKYEFVSEYGTKELDVSSIYTEETMISADGTSTKAISSDGRYIMFLPKKKDGYSFLYAFDGNGDGSPLLISEAVSDFKLLDGSRIAFIDKASSINKVTILDLSSGVRKDIDEASSFYSLSYDNESGVLSYLKEGGALHLYYTDSEKIVKINEQNYSSFVLSPNSETVAFTEVSAGVFSSYLYKDGEVTPLGENLIACSVTDDGKYIYAKNSAGDEVYSIVDQTNLRKLAEGAAIESISKNKKQILLSSETGVYLSANGNFPVKIHDQCTYFYPITSCENGFVGEIFYVGSRSSPGLWRMRGDCSLVSLSRGQGTSSHTLLSDEKTVVFADNNLVYRTKAGLNEKIEVIGPGCLFANFERNGKAAYSISGGIQYVKGGKSKIVDSGIVNSITVLSHGGAVYLKDAIPDSLSVSDINDEAFSTQKGYDAYYTKNGKAGKYIMSNVKEVYSTNTTLYIVTYSAKTVESYEGNLYDIYAGTDIDSLERIISGVLLPSQINIS